MKASVKCWSLVDKQGRLLAGPKFLDILFVMTIDLAIIALFQVYRVPWEASLLSLARIYIPSPMHILVNNVLAAVITWLIYVGCKNTDVERRPRWSVRALFLNAGLWVWSSDIALAWFVHVGLIPVNIYSSRSLLALGVFLVGLCGAWSTLRIGTMETIGSEA